VPASGAGDLGPASRDSTSSYTAGTAASRSPTRSRSRRAPTLSDGQRVQEHEIIEFCRAHLARFKAPAAVEFGPLPKTSTGKVQKNVLRDREWADRATRIN